MIAEFLLELIGTFITEVVFNIFIRKVFSLPGAFIYWVFTGFSKPFSEIYKNNTLANVLVTIVAILIITLLIT